MPAMAKPVPGIDTRMRELRRSARRAAPLLKVMSNPSRLVIYHY